MKKLLLSTAAALVFASPALASNSNSVVNQAGIANDANVNQVGSATGSNSAIGQLGTSNEADVVQADDGSGTQPTNASTISQVGVDNYAKVDQLAESAPGTTNSSNIVQQGLNNNAYLTQRDDGQSSSIEQTSNWNLAVVNQGQAGVGDTTYENTSFVVQTGEGDTFHEAYVDQIGRQNYSEVYQDGLSQLAEVDQTGNGNQSSITQHGENNHAVALQTGNNNASNILQDGLSNFAGNGQYGNGNQSSITQNGTTNWAVTEQFTDNNTSVVNQLGLSNVSYVAQ